MLAFKKFANGFGIILATLLSVVLLAVLLAAPVVSAVCSFTDTKTIHKIIKDIDFVELVMRHQELRDTLAEYGIDGHFLDAITETVLTEELVEAYVESIFEGKAFDPHVAEDIILSHKAETVSLFRRIAEERGNDTAGITDDEFLAMILDAVHTKWEEFTAVLPSAEDMGLTQEDYDNWAAVYGAAAKPLNAPLKLTEQAILSAEPTEKEISAGQLIMYMRTGAPVTAVIITAAILSVLILLLRWPRFQGFIWLAVVYLLAAVLLFACTGGLSSQGAQQLIPAEGVLELLIVPVLSVFTAEMIRYGVVLAVLGFAFVAAFLLGRALLRGCRQRRDEQARICDAPQIEVQPPAVEEAQQGIGMIEE